MSKEKNGGVLSLLSVLSILAAFIAVCFVVIWILVSAGVMNVSWISAERTQKPEQSENGEGMIIRGVTDTELDENSMRAVLSNIPFSDRFYSRFFTTYFGRYGEDGVGGIFKIEAYDVYRSADKYKIITYNNFMQPQKTVVCNGERVRVTDETSGTYSDFEISDEFSFAALSPMPDFSVFKTGKYEVTEFYFEDGEYHITCRHTEADMVDVIRINAETGVLTYFKTEFGGDRMSEYTLFNYDTDYKFADSEFTIG